MKRTVSAIFMAMLLTSMLYSAFKIMPAEAAGTIYIRADGSIDPPTAPISRDGDTYTFTGNVSDGAIVVERDNVVVDGAGYTVQGTGTYGSKGIGLSGRSNVTIKSMIIRYFWEGIILEYSSNNTISENKVTNNSFLGIYLSESNNNSLSGNNITANNGWAGIMLEFSSNYNIISGNNITANNECSIRLFSSSNNIISGNNITNNLYGIWLWRSSNYNIISGNSITNNVYGIEVYSSSSNSIFHNNFINNAQQAFSSDDSVDVWDDGYPSGGNYWSDYTGTDVFSGSYQNETGSDGIGDTPYIINGQNLDHYPLTVHNVAITDVLSKTVVCQNCSAQIDVAFTNEGNYAETSNVTVYANTTVIATFTDINLARKESTTLTFNWDTTGFAKESYIIWAYVDPVANETETADNTYIGSGITISMQGDVNADSIVDIFDIVIVALEFGHPPPPIVDLRADVNKDGLVDIFDIVVVALHFGETS